jgi:site-specific DNA-methyltransferase (adenine-specific)
MEKDIIYQKDCIEGMKELPSACANVIIADPPYNIGKDFGNDSDKQGKQEYYRWCERWIDECLRILKPDGTLYIYGISENLSYIRVSLEPIDGPPKCSVRWIIWHYTNKVVPGLKFWQRSHESILVCYKSSNKVFNRDNLREEYTRGFLNGCAGKERPSTKGRFSNGEKTTTYNAHSLGALPRDVIKGIPTLAGGAGKKEGVNHPTQKPLKLCEKLLKACIKEGEENVLVVPFCGSGSECVAAAQLGIRYVAYELNKDYIDVANERLSK